MSTELLQPPELSVRELIAGDEREQSRQEVYEEAAHKVMTGQGDFWNQIVRPYDADQEMPIFAAVGIAVMNAATNCSDDAEFKQIVMDAVWHEAKRYASYVIEEM